MSKVSTASSFKDLQIQLIHILTVFKKQLLKKIAWWPFWTWTTHRKGKKKKKRKLWYLTITITIVIVSICWALCDGMHNTFACRKLVGQTYHSDFYSFPTYVESYLLDVNVIFKLEMSFPSKEYNLIFA